MKKLTVVMPFLKENFEPINTIISMNNTDDSSTFEIIAVCDEPYYEFEKELKKFDNVILVKNEHTIGVDASRSIGINMASTPAILVIDGHMRFAKDNWVDKIYDACMQHKKTLWCTRSLVLNDEMPPEKINPFIDVRDMATHYSLGANLFFYKDDRGLFGLSWSEASSCIERSEGLLSCVLGANYACSTEWLKTIRAFEGLMDYGFSEQYISIKSWLLGGDCRGLDTVSIGHIFRSTAPYIQTYGMHVYNKLFTIHTLLCDETELLQYAIDIMKQKDPNGFSEGSDILQKRWDIVLTYQSYFMKMKKKKLTEVFDKFNMPYKEVL